jgi:hypothetical protein
MTTMTGAGAATLSGIKTRASRWMVADVAADVSPVAVALACAGTGIDVFKVVKVPAETCPSTPNHARTRAVRIFRIPID